MEEGWLLPAVLDEDKMKIWGLESLAYSNGLIINISNVCHFNLLFFPRAMVKTNTMNRIVTVHRTVT